MPTHPQRPLVLKTGVQFTVKLRYVFPFFCSKPFILLASYSWEECTHYTVAKVLRSRGWAKCQVAGGCLLSKFNLHSGFTLYQAWWQLSVWEIQTDSRSDTCRLFFPCKVTHLPIYFSSKAGTCISSTDTANLSRHYTSVTLYGARLGPIHVPELCCSNIPVISSTIAEQLSFVVPSFICF